MGNWFSSEAEMQTDIQTEAEAAHATKARELLDKTCMHEVLPNELWLGNQYGAGFADPMVGVTPVNALAKLKERGITHILSCIDKPKLFENEGMEYLVVPMSDSQSFDLIPCLETTNQFIESAVANGGKVFVHCQMGQSRSAATVMAFIMKTQGLSFAAAFAYVKSKRRFIKKENFETHLIEYEATVVSSASAAAAASAPGGRE